MSNKTINAAGLNLTPEQLESLKQGNAIGGSLKDGIGVADVYTPASSTPIQGYKSRIKPVIRAEDGTVLEQSLVTAANMSKNNSTHEAEMKRIRDAEAKAEAELQELRSYMDPNKLMAEISYLTRAVKKLQKDFKSLEKGNAN